LPTKGFFDEIRQQSQAKMRIVSHYFEVWAKVIMPTVKKWGSKIAYVDLFAGPGLYKDGTRSTPLLVLEKAVENPDLRQRLITIFNDADPNNARSLEEAIKSVKGIEALKHHPKVSSRTIINSADEIMREVAKSPTLLFVDPWGYKGLSLKMISSFIKEWGSECIFFFNYNRINMSINNRKVEDLMNVLFGKERADRLRGRLKSMRPAAREEAIVNEIIEELKEHGGEYVLTFCFKDDTGKRTSHYLIFVTKNPKGSKIMRSIMSMENYDHSQGTSLLEYSPAAAIQPALISDEDYWNSILKEQLLTYFNGRRLQVEAICEQYGAVRAYSAKSYKRALRELEAEGKISAVPPAEKRPSRLGVVTFADDVWVTFPKKS